MPSLEAVIETGRASRYLVQFCKHASAIGARGHATGGHRHGPSAGHDLQVEAEWTESSGTVTFVPWGRCELAAEPGRLTVRVEASGPAELARIKDVISRDLDRFSRRAPLTVTWSESHTS
ncbi:DUF2218 domain-containing protein [Spirillospora sp. NPDC052269]